MIVGHGIDIVEINGFGRLFTPMAIPYLDRYFTKDELSYAGVDINRIPRLAARFAVKEAVLKALGKGWGCGVSFTDIEVRKLESGAPALSLDRNLRAYSESLGITSWHVSISHTTLIAIASVIAIKEN